MLCLVVPLVLAAGPAWATATGTAARGVSSATAARGASGADDGEVACPADLDGVPLATDEDFAGTPRALANDEGVLVRYTLLCPYHRASGRPVADLTLAWSRYDADDLNCETLELTSESAGDGRVEGAIDHPSLSARVTYEAASAAVLPGVEDVAAELLTRVPGDAAPCVGGGDSGVDASIADPESTSSTGMPIALAVVLLAGTAAVVLVVGIVLRRGRRRRAEAERARAVEPGVSELAAALRARRNGDGAPAPGTPAVPPPPEPDEGRRDDLDERRQALEVLRLAEDRRAALEASLLAARGDLAVHRAHAEAVRRLVASVRAEREYPEYLSSFAGLMALAVAATNLVSTSARRGASLVDDDTVAARADLLDRLHHDVIVAAEAGLDDSRFWLWQDRRLAVVQALTVLERLAPRLVALQQRLAAEVAALGHAHEMAGHDAAWARAALRDLDEGGAGATALTAPGTRTTGT